jgi:tRNA dimethylallyltransferase
MNPPPLPLALCLMGPTATGKTALALRLVEEFPFTIVSVDSSLVYRGMDIGTAKPSAAELVRAPHRLIDIRDPAQAYSAAEFRTDALAAMADIAGNGRIPLLVGGTMFYFRALEFGLSALPPADAGVRARLSAAGREQGWVALHARLAAVDPVTAARISPNDSQRIQRALEIHELTGLPPSAVNAQAPPQPAPWEFIKLALMPSDRDWLRTRIATRFHAMLEQGLLAEVEALWHRADLHPDLPSIRMVGYRQAWEYLSERINYTQLVERGIMATRQLAKRQLTWLRRYPGLNLFDPCQPKIEQEILEFARETLRKRESQI